jgi:hypothetical protein
VITWLNEIQERRQICVLRGGDVTGNLSGHPNVTSIASRSSASFVPIARLMIEVRGDQNTTQNMNA